MGWFGSGDKQPLPPAQPVVNGPTLESFRAQLEAVGQFRLKVRRPEMKAFVTQIAWNGERHLLRQSIDGKPSGAQLVKASSALDTALQVIRAYAQHEQQVSLFDHEGHARLAKELTAIKQYADSLTVTSSSTGFAASMNADVNTELLQRLTQNSQ